MKRYAVFGQPISHSLSPRIHALFGEQCGIGIDYRAIEAGRDTFAATLDAFARDGGVGANVTLPLKEDAFALCATLSQRARRCGSVNTLIRDGDGWRGDSTDGIGFLRDLEREGFEPEDRHVLLLGAGGAARAVAVALLDAGAHRLTIANRTRERAAALARALGPRARGCAPGELDVTARFDLIVNASAAGHGGGLFALPGIGVTPATFCHDLSYGSAARPFLDWAQRAGAGHIHDGLGMLVEQAAESFARWHGRRPATAPVLDALRA